MLFLYNLHVEAVEEVVDVLPRLRRHLEKLDVFLRGI